MCIRDRCKLSHGRLTRWILALQEYHITCEYIPGHKNVAADVLSRINVIDQTFEGEEEQDNKVCNKKEKAIIMKEKEINLQSSFDKKVS